MMSNGVLLINGPKKDNFYSQKINMSQTSYVRLKDEFHPIQRTSTLRASELLHMPNIGQRFNHYISLHHSTPYQVLVV
jgi:hypothetical protein